jgi:hypothetical protein
VSFQRPSKDPATWRGWTAHDHVAAAERLWEMALVEFTGVHTVKVGGLLQEAEVHLTRAKILAVRAEVKPFFECCDEIDTVVVEGEAST